MNGRPDISEASIQDLEYLVSPIVMRRGDELEKDADGNPVDMSRPGSQQINSEDENEDIVPPPIDLKLWATQLARNTRLGRGIRIIARNTVGLGWSIIPAEKITEDTPQSEIEAIRAEQSRVKAFFDDLNPTKTFETLFECAVMDEEAVGNGYLEITRKGDGSLDKCYHVPGTTMRVLRDGRGFAQVRGGKTKYFKPFGEPRVMDALTGKYDDEEGFNPSEWASSRTSSDPLPANRRASEIIHLPLYSPLSEIYGLPRFISAGAAIAGNYHAARRNVAFFRHDAVPRMAVLVSGGGEITKESKTELTNMFREGKGADNHGRTLVIETAAKGSGVDEKSAAKVELKPLTVGGTEDGSFLNYRRMNDEEIREALGLSEVYFKSEKLTKASATVAKSTTDEQEFEPARLLKEKLINKLLVNGTSGLNAKRVKFHLTRPDTTDPVEKSQVHKTYSEIGALTPNEVRADLGRDPLPETETWANTPIAVALPAAEGKILHHSRLAVEPAPEAPPAQDPTNDPDANNDPQGDANTGDSGASSGGSTGNQSGGSVQRSAPVGDQVIVKSLEASAPCAQLPADPMLTTEVVANKIRELPSLTRAARTTAGAKS